MPTYEYECTSCGHAFERFQGINDAPLTACPECGGTVRRLISSGGGILFKGSGFYATDYRRGTPPSGGADAPAKKSGEGSGPKADAGGKAPSGKPGPGGGGGSDASG